VSLAAPLARAAPARSVVTVHDVAWRRHPEATTRRGRSWHEAALCRARDSGASLVVTSQFVAADLIGDGVAVDRITIVKGGSDHLMPEDAAQTDALLGRLGVQGGFLLTVSTLEPRKNVDRLLQAYQRVRRSLPEPWPLVIVGPAGWGNALPGVVEQEGVILAGAVSDATLSGLYRRARAFAYVPLTEGYGLPPLEAMRFGTPAVVANEVPSVHDLQDEGPPPARIVNPFDVDDIAAGLAAVLIDDAVRADLSVRGETYARARTWQAAARQHVTLWRTLI
jgi:glycosyltransferase involved in cell wall biosynthesis